MKIVDRLKLFIEAKGISLNEFDKSIGVSSGYIGKHVRGEGSIGSHILEKIFAVYPELSVRWLLTGEGEMLEKDGDSLSERESKESVSYSFTSDITALKVDEKLLAGIVKKLNLPLDLKEVDPDLTELEELDLSKELLSKSSNLLVKYSGDEMTPAIPPGVLLFLEKISFSNTKELNLNMVYLIAMESGISLGRLINSGKAEIMLRRDNPDKLSFPDIQLKTSAISTIWCVKGFILSQITYNLLFNDFMVSVTGLERRISSLLKEVRKLKSDLKDFQGDNL